MAWRLTRHRGGQSVKIHTYSNVEDAEKAAEAILLKQGVRPPREGFQWQQRTSESVLLIGSDEFRATNIKQFNNAEPEEPSIGL